MVEVFTRVGSGQYGYSPKQVDNFLAYAKEKYAELNAKKGDQKKESDSGAHIKKRSRRHSLRTSSPNVRSVIREVQSVSHAAFKLVRGGYAPQAVDAALGRLEEAFIKRRRADVISRYGEKVWLDSAYEYATTLYPRLKREPSERFADARKYGYEKDSVDNFLDEIREYFTGSGELTSKEVRSVIFPRAKNSGAYDMAVVDAYLERLAAVLLSVE